MLFNRYLHLVLVAAATVTLTACGTATNYRYNKSINHPKRPQVERVSFNPSDIQRSSGTAHLVGRAYLRDERLFEERVGEFVDVVLNPVSKASEQWFSEVCRKGKVLKGKVSPVYEKAMYQTKTNSYGQFAFPSIPAGEYFLTTRLYWMDTSRFSGPVEYGGLLAKRIRLQDGAQTLDLNQRDRCPGYYH